MSLLQSRNPAFDTFEEFGGGSMAETRSKTMTIGGTVSATGILLAIVAGVGIFMWQQMVSGGSLSSLAFPILIASLIGGFVVSLVIYKAPKMAPVIAPVHAILEGAFVGVASYVIPMRFLGGEIDPNTGSNAMQLMILQAVLATMAIAVGLLIGYASGLLRVGHFVQKMIVTIGIGLAMYVGALFLLRLFGIHIWNGFADVGPIGIGFTALCVLLASLFLLLDFQHIEEGVNSGAPKYMEWVGAWGLMVTLVWLYIEILRLLAKLAASSDD